MAWRSRAIASHGLLAPGKLPLGQTQERVVNLAVDLDTFPETSCTFAERTLRPSVRVSCSAIARAIMS